MSKQDIDTNNDALITNVARYEYLALLTEKTEAQKNELAALEILLVDYKRSAAEYNANLAAINSNSSDIFTNAGNIGTNGDSISSNSEYKLTTGTANTQLISPSVIFDLTKNGNILHMNPSLTNTGAFTINPNSQGAEDVKKFDIDTDDYIALEAEDVKKFTQIDLRWDLAEGFFVLAPSGGGINYTLDYVDEGRMYYARWSVDLAAEINLDNFAIIGTEKTLTVGGGGHSGLGGMAWKLYFGVGDAWLMDTEDVSNDGKVTQYNTPSNVGGLGGTENRLYYENSNLLREVNPVNFATINEVTGTASDPKGMGGIHNRLYTGDNSSFNIRELNLDTMAVINTVSVGGITHLGVGGAYDRLYVSGSSVVTENNPDTLAILDTTTIGNMSSIGGLSRLAYKLTIDSIIEDNSGFADIEYNTGVYRRDFSL